MKPDYEQRLEAAIDRELKGLPELKAPAALSANVMTVLQSRAAGIAHSSWETWSWPMKALSFASLALLFGAICYGSSYVVQGPSYASAAQRVGNGLAEAEVLWSALTAVLNALVLGVRQLGTPVVVGLLVAAGLGYAMCVGLGTLYLRLALARR